MDRDALRGVQEPLKERYRDDPDAAVVTLTCERDARRRNHLQRRRPVVRSPRRACTRRAAETD